MMAVCVYWMLFGLVCECLLLWMCGRYAILHWNVLWLVVQIGFKAFECRCLWLDLTWNRNNWITVLIWSWIRLLWIALFSRV